MREDNKLTNVKHLLEHRNGNNPTMSHNVRNDELDAMKHDGLVSAKRKSLFDAHADSISSGGSCVKKKASLFAGDNKALADKRRTTFRPKLDDGEFPVQTSASNTMQEPERPRARSRDRHSVKDPDSSWKMKRQVPILTPPPLSLLRGCLGSFQRIANIFVPYILPTNRKHLHCSPTAVPTWTSAAPQCTTFSDGPPLLL